MKPRSVRPGLGREAVLRGLGLAVVLVFRAGSSLEAQEAEERAFRVDAFGSVDRVYLYSGDATVGAYSGWGLTGSIALRSRSPVGGEVFFAFSPKDSDPYSRSPRLLIPGGWVTVSFIGDPTSGADMFLAVGATYMHTAGWLDYSGCQPPECFAEGGPNFRNGGEFRLVWGAGFAYHLPKLLSLRMDLRVPSGIPRVGAGVGVRVR